MKPVRDSIPGSIFCPNATEERMNLLAPGTVEVAAITYTIPDCKDKYDFLPAILIRTREASTWLVHEQRHNIISHSQHQAFSCPYELELLEISDLLKRPCLRRSQHSPL